MMVIKRNDPRVPFIFYFVITHTLTVVCVCVGYLCKIQNKKKVALVC